MPIATDQLDQTVDRIAARFRLLLTPLHEAQLADDLAKPGESSEDTSLRLMQTAQRLMDLALLMQSAALRIKELREAEGRSEPPR